MSQHKLVKPQSQTLTRQEGESLPQGRSALIPEHGTSSLLGLSLGFGGMRVWLPADVRFCTLKLKITDVALRPRRMEDKRVAPDLCSRFS